MIVMEDVVVDAGAGGAASDGATSRDAVVLDGVSLHVDEGEFVVLLGASGAGKSTLLRTIVGLAKIRRGTVRVNGRALSARTAGAIRREIAYVDQEPVLGADEQTVRAALLRPFDLHANRGLRPDDETLRAALESVSLDESIRTKALRVISGGEKQRLSMVRAALLRRPILLADEPTSALDANHRRKAAEALRKMADCALVATHDVDLIRRATRVLRLKEGRLREIHRDAAIEGERDHERTDDY